MASLTRNSKSGYFYAQFFDSTQIPSRKTVPLRTTKKRIATRALIKLQDSIALGDFDPWESKEEPVEVLRTIREAVDAYLASCSHLKANTQVTYRDILIPFQKHLGDEYPLSKINVRAILAWLESTSTNDVTRKKYVKHLGYMFRFLVTRGDMEIDISKNVPLRKIPETAPKSMTRDEVSLLLRTIRAYSNSSQCRHNVDWLADLIEANVHLGLRRGELIHLKWDHVDFDRRVLVVKNTEDFTTKSSKERAIPLCEQATSALMRRRDHAMGPLVFHFNGQPFKPGTLTKAFKKFRMMTGIPRHINLHSTRHTFGTWLAETGVPVTVIQSLMGHSSVTTTERYMSTRADVAEQWLAVAFDS